MHFNNIHYILCISLIETILSVAIDATIPYMCDIANMRLSIIVWLKVQMVKHVKLHVHGMLCSCKTP